MTPEIIAIVTVCLACASSRLGLWLRHGSPLRQSNSTMRELDSQCLPLLFRYAHRMPCVRTAKSPVLARRCGKIHCLVEAAQQVIRSL